MGNLEFEGLDVEATKALVEAFLGSVDSEGQDLREEVHGCTLDELTQQLAVLGAVLDLGVTYTEATYLAGRLRQLVSHPDERERR